MFNENPSLHSLNSSHTITCNFCGKYGHTKVVCFRKVGFPSGNVKTSKFSFTRKVCTFCNRLGHTVDTCYKKHGFPPGYKFTNWTSQANNMITTDTFSELFPKEQDVKGIQLTSQQCQFLTNILRQQNLEDPAPHTQINQVGSISTDEISNTEHSSTGKFLSSLSAIKESWIINSGATDHVCHNLNVFTTYTKIKPVLISLPNGQTVYATYSGLVRFSDQFYLSDVLYVPHFQLNLISVSKLTHQLKCTLTFTSTHCIIQDNLTQERIGTVKATAGLYLVTTLPASSHSKPHCFAPFINCNITDKTLWHYRLGHPSHERLHVLSKQYSFITVDTHHVCDTCSRAKQRKLPFTLSNIVTSAIFYLVHFDIWGPCSIISMQGFRYFLTIFDDYSRYTWVILLHNKSEVRQHIINFTVFVQNHFKTNIKTIRTDNGVEFAMSNFYASKGIIHKKSCVETLQQNGIVERKHQHILNVTRALLFQANLPPIFWEFAVNHVVFLINAIPTPLLDNITPHEKLFGKPYDISFLKVFGCLCYASTITAHRKKIR